MKNDTTVRHASRHDKVTAYALVEGELTTLRQILAYHMDDLLPEDGTPYDATAFLSLCETFGVEIPAEVQRTWDYRPSE